VAVALGGLDDVIDACISIVQEGATMICQRGEEFFAGPSIRKEVGWMYSMEVENRKDG
jgi:hypothetical protein